jgi:hypothetical protein
LVAKVTRPYWSTVIVGLVYVVGATPEFARAIVPEDVITPPVSPAPAVTEVTVPVGPEAGREFVIV